MSRKIQQILDVLTIVRAAYLGGQSTNIQTLRIDATTEIADREGLYRTTVLDKYQRGLEPDIYGTDAFDAIVSAWLIEGSTKLQQILGDHAVDNDDSQKIATFFGTEQVIEKDLYERMQLLTALVEKRETYSAEFDHESVEDERLVVARELVQRQGQHFFRSMLLENYHHRCCVTGTAVTEILEAAHISPYLGVNSNHPTNGLLLRADIHTLFDYGLLAIHENDYSILVSPRILDSVYRLLHGQSIRLPEDEKMWPDFFALQKHRLAAKL